MIDNLALQNILLTATDISTVCEVYDSDAVPTDDGFDPVDAIDCFAAVDGITYRTRDYKRLVSSFGNIKRTIETEINSTSVTFNNLDREISEFEFTTGFEGLILVVRLLSRSLSTALTDSQILFAGRCEKPKSGKRESLQVTAKFILDSQSVTIPRRKFTPIDPRGREQNDPEFEGFVYMPRSGNLTYSVRERRGGLLGLFGLKKSVNKTLPFSTYSALDANRYLPEVFGMTQIMLTHVGWFDAGTHLQIREAACEGEIEDFINTRSVDPSLPMDGVAYAEQLGLVGAANGDDPAWVAGGFYYSRTAMIRGQIDNSAMDVTDAAPDIVSIIKGRKLRTPDGSGDWVVTQWTDNPAAVIYYLLVGSDLGPDYYALDENWLDIGTFNTCYDYNAENIMDPSSSDFLFLE